MSKFSIDSKAIKKRMIDMDIDSISELSRQANISRPKIHHYLTDEMPLATTFLRLCAFLDMEPDELILFDGVRVCDIEGISDMPKAYPKKVQKKN